jgi:hypothetical protein
MMPLASDADRRHVSFAMQLGVLPQPSFGEVAKDDPSIPLCMLRGPAWKGERCASIFGTPLARERNFVVLPRPPGS